MRASHLYDVLWVYGLQLAQTGEVKDLSLHKNVHAEQEGDQTQKENKSSEGIVETEGECSIDWIKDHSHSILVDCIVGLGCTSRTVPRVLPPTSLDASLISLPPTQTSSPKKKRKRWGRSEGGEGESGGRDEHRVRCSSCGTVSEDHGRGREADERREQLKQERLARKRLQEERTQNFEEKKRKISELISPHSQKENRRQQALTDSNDADVIQFIEAEKM
ncbi:hypothetical protein BLNAU_22761 [Blattamonas nauphoetae]|uniref:Uncharacterized protein n=1 Tax=Blattamonas nauphoetae TaxID=2049346 RepID=A0ABQ9WS65_9EUKA|nr:hypothetical protein BLNAU_22761 [Blattamonas nauphoetae]